MPERRTEIEISARPDRVRRGPTALDAHPRWNPLIRSNGAAPRVGARLTMRIQPHRAEVT